MSPMYPREYAFPDITPHANGNTGTPYVFQFDSGAPGPTVMICALTHGNEAAGAVVLNRLLSEGFRPRRGRLILSFNNFEAYARFDPGAPDASRFVDEDLNRVWDLATLDGPRDSVELRRARALRPFVDQADYLLDLHSMHEAAPPILVCGKRHEAAEFGKTLGAPATLLIDQGHSQGARMRDYGLFGQAQSGKHAALIECGQHWEAAAPRVAFDVTARFLLRTGLCDPTDLNPAWQQPDSPAQRIVSVEQTIVAETNHFRFAQPFRGMEILKQGDMIATDGAGPNAKLIRAPFDGCVLIMPSIRHAVPGVTVVRLGRYSD